MVDSEFGIFLNGSYGVGKSATLDHLADRFAENSLPFSLFDVDWFHRSWPPAPSDPRNVVTEADNIRAVWNNYRRTGPHTPIVAGVILEISRGCGLDRRNEWRKVLLAWDDTRC
ncbi:hypothetical protein M3G50_15575 [Brachybacterium muris]|uniref:hypothetical protein n=1 Tax=Brachybacterium muris TaxID=219301 RepID=UPI0021A44182|nr:hypothetical protein [Brachybacterium muris]MCT1432144.1 hypothetical protein [Brachybacterium muris]